MKYFVFLAAILALLAYMILTPNQTLEMGLATVPNPLSGILSQSDSEPEVDEENLSKTKIEARIFLDRLARLELNQDQAAAELYADSAVIKIHLRDIEQKPRTVWVTGDEMKEIYATSEIIEPTIQREKRYVGATYRVVGDEVRIRSTRLSSIAEFEGWHALTIKKDSYGEWLIYEESFELGQSEIEYWIQLVESGLIEDE